MGRVCLEYGMMHGAVIPRFPPLGQQVKSLDDGQGLTTVNPLSDLRPTRVVTTLPLRSSCLVKCHAQKKHEQNALHPAPQYPTVLACSSLHSLQCNSVDSGTILSMYLTKAGGRRQEDRRRLERRGRKGVPFRECLASIPYFIPIQGLY
jgi:hypothetical protein